MRDRLSAAEARRVALHAQGLAGPRPARDPGRADLRRVIDRVGVIQIDSVNVLARAHLMPAYARLGPYDVGLLERAAGRAPRLLVETWAHEASFVPPSTHRLLAWRRRAYRTEAWGSTVTAPDRYPELITEVRAVLAERGPMTAREVAAIVETDAVRAPVDWGWNWSATKIVLEHLFYVGEITAARRNAAFERLYDLTGRVLPAAASAAPEPAEADAVRELIAIGARAHGVGTAACFADYFRIRGPRVERAMSELVEAGDLVPVTVSGWDRPTYRHRDAVLPRRATARTLLSPFDPLVFERRRLHALFGMHFRIEIYTPAERRVWGYYCLPFLLGDRLVARVDLKHDRAAGVILVPAVHLEAGAEAGPTVEALAAELADLARWLGARDVVVPEGAAGDLAPALRAAVTRM